MILNSDIHRDDIRLIITTHWTLNSKLLEYFQFKDYLTLVTAWENWDVLTSFPWEKHDINSHKLKTILETDMTLPMTGCEAGRNYSKLSTVGKI